jgi:hypothetical protein
MEWHYKNEGLKLIGTECVTKLIMALWDNLHRIWTYRNTRFHKKDNETILLVTKERRWTDGYTQYGKKRASVRDNMLPFQARHFANRRTVENLHYERKRCWANLAEMYTEEARMPVSRETYSLSTYLNARLYYD